MEDGKRVWVLAKINRDPCEIVSGDPIEKYILLSNSHDGTLAARVGFTPIRVVCTNTLAHADNASKLIRVRHTASAKQTLDDIRQTMGAANQEFDATADLYRKLARTPLTGGDLEKYVKKAVGLEQQENSLGSLAGRRRVPQKPHLKRHRNCSPTSTHVVLEKTKPPPRNSRLRGDL